MTIVTMIMPVVPAAVCCTLIVAALMMFRRSKTWVTTLLISGSCLGLVCILADPLLKYLFISYGDYYRTQNLIAFWTHVGGQIGWVLFAAGFLGIALQKREIPARTSRKPLVVGCLVCAVIVALGVGPRAGWILVDVQLSLLHFKLDMKSTQLRVAQLLALACQSDQTRVPEEVSGACLPKVFGGLDYVVGPPVLTIREDEAIAHWAGGLLSWFGYCLKLDATESTASTNVWCLYYDGQRGMGKTPLVTVALAKTEHLSEEDIALLASSGSPKEEREEKHEVVYPQVYQPKQTNVIVPQQN